MAAPWLGRLKPGLLKKKGVTVSEPFGPGIPVFKVSGKMFAVFSSDDGEEWITLKCDPEMSLALRAEHKWIEPGYHTNKRLWITLRLSPKRPAALVRELLDDAYLLAAQGLTKAEHGRLGLALPPRTRAEVTPRR